MRLLGLIGLIWIGAIVVVLGAAWLFPKAGIDISTKFWLLPSSLGVLAVPLFFQFIPDKTPGAVQVGVRALLSIGLGIMTYFVSVYAALLLGPFFIGN